MTDQEKREKVVRGLECCMSGQPDGLGCSRVPCPYNQFVDCEGILHRDALALLKAQEPVEPTIGGDADGPCGNWWYQCGKCKEAIDYHDSYCGNCGRAVKWE